MDDITRRFVAAAEAGESVFVTDVRRSYLGLPPEDSFPLTVVVRAIDGGDRRYALRLPRFGSYDEAGRRFVLDFFLAEIYNILSSLGGRAVTLVNPGKAREAEALAREFNERFGVERERRERVGYGKCLNVLDRIIEALPAGGGDGAGFAMVLAEEEPPPAALSGAAAADVAGMFARAARGLEGKVVLGMDIGGTDIKLALAVDGGLARFKEFDWFPASFTRMDQMIDPVATLVRLMALAAVAERTGDSALAERLEPAFSAQATPEEMETVIASAPGGDPGPVFDAIGMCFPDVVIDNKIVGGEVFKTRGMREALGAAYDAEFARLTDLDRVLSPYVKAGGRVAIINDGPMAAFTAGVEAAAKNPGAVVDGVFAYTLGTELGTGWVDERGEVPRIPLEVYNFIVDLGSRPEREYEPDDLRSINNFNTGLPGTLQKIACQSGVFRLALKYLPGERPELAQKLFDAGFVVEGEKDGRKGLYVPTSPRDMRKPFLEFMMELAEREDEPAVRRIFREIGLALAVAGEEIDWILRPAARERILFGRLVKRASCFSLMLEGARSRGCGDLRAADDGMAETPLMRALSESGEYTVAQFAQAVGAIYYGNLANAALHI